MSSAQTSPAVSKRRARRQKPKSAERSVSTPRGAPTSLTDAAVGIIRDRILDLTLKPGSWIDEKLLMKQFKLSRTPAREALNRLVAEGLVDIQSYKGAQVIPLDIGHILQFLDAYIASERMNGFFCNTAHANLVSDMSSIEERYENAADAEQFLEMTRLNAALHHRIAAATENFHIADFSARLQNLSRRLTIFLMEIEAGINIRPGDHQRAIRADHNAMIEAIQQNDNDGLVQILTGHAEQFHARVTQAMSKSSAPSFPLHQTS